MTTETGTMKKTKGEKKRDFLSPPLGVLIDDGRPNFPLFLGGVVITIREKQTNQTWYTSVEKRGKGKKKQRR
jgi:hypothetical protein